MAGGTFGFKNHVVNLLRLSGSRGSSRGNEVQAHPPIIAVINLAFCVYFEHYLRNDVEAYYLSLFIFLESCTWILLMIGYFVRSLNPILVRTAVFPVAPMSRYVFVLAAGVRRPVMVGLWLSNLLFLAVLYHRSLVLAVSALVLYSFMLLVFSAATASVLFFFVRLSRPATGVGVLVVLGFIVLIGGTYLFHASSLVGNMPVIVQTTSALAAIQQGELMRAGWNAGWLVVFFCAAMFMGKRLA